MKLAALCCTYRRPHTLGHLIESFLRQDYPKGLRELIVLDDAGQYPNQEGDGWRLLSLPRRFRSLGEKRNACAALASSDVEGFLVADDDDVYLPHWFRSQAEALKRAKWSRPSLVLLEDGPGLREVETHGLYHGGWAFRRSIFDRVRGYGPHNNGEDQELAGRLTGVRPCDPCDFAEPFYVYRNDNGSYHLSWMGERGYQELAAGAERGSDLLSIGWPRDFTKLPVRRLFGLAPHVSHQDGKMRVELVGPVNAPGRDGPTNGMYALQKELRKRIADGLDWLAIRSLPVSDGALPWFWNWQDRRYAVWWNSQGRPFVQGPNLLFTYSNSPRLDGDECALLDAAHCRAMFCHSEWYRNLIAQHRGPANPSSIIMWPYPIDPRPGPPLPAEYDLLIYAKNGHRPGLLEHLAEAFPRHVQIHYGQYHREQLFDAARRSRACAYLADDDHGPLALQEILLAGCPAVGVRTGASLLQDKVTGIVASRLPPGLVCAASDRDEDDLRTYLDAIARAQAFDRHAVASAAAEQFDAGRIVDRIAACLDERRTVDAVVR